MAWELQFAKLFQFVITKGTHFKQRVIDAALVVFLIFVSNFKVASISLVFSHVGAVSEPSEHNLLYFSIIINDRHNAFVVVLPTCHTLFKSAFFCFLLLLLIEPGFLLLCFFSFLLLLDSKAP